MSKVWELYENMNDMVFVADMETDEMVYMNRLAREKHGITDCADLRGKKCHEILIGFDCSYGSCSTDDLAIGEYKEWNYYNPVLRKQFAIKDTVVEEDGRLYRLEIAIDTTNWDTSQMRDDTEIDSASLINEGIRIALSNSAADDASIDTLLAYIGKSLRSDRAYIFEEKEGGIYANTYEWCADGVIPQKDNLQNLAVADTEIWLERFRTNNNVIIKSLDDIKESDPFMYDYLLPQDIHSLVTSPLIYKNKIIGFYGVDNPPAALLDGISNLFLITGHFICLLLKRAALFKKLIHLSYYDQLTGAGNRHAMEEYTEALDPERSLGVVYCDVTGLKRVNDTAGHKEGDALLVRACDCLRDIFCEPDEVLFRVGGDEFLVLCQGITEDKLLDKVSRLKMLTREKSVLLATGAVWRANANENIDRLLTEADSYMYEDKREYYAEHDRRMR
jgi:diguanylate cyclase (GGDEF)-like protein